MAKDNVKRFKKGECLFKENDEIDKIYFIQSGRVSLNVIRSGHQLDFDILTNSNIVGEQAMLGNKRQNYNATAMSEVKAMEFPLSLLSNQVNTAAPSIKLVLASVVAEVKRLRGLVRSHAGDQDSSPCPQKFIPRLFSTFHLVAQHSMQESEEGERSISWAVLKIYTTRMFLESQIRMEKVLEILSKHKYVTLEYIANDDGGDELSEIKLHDIALIEHFSEFYQYNYFKPGKSEIIYVDEMAYKVLKSLIAVSTELEPDWRGLVHFDYEDMVRQIEDKFNFELKVLHLNVLEKKGLFVKRTSRDEGGVDFSFEKEEFERILKFWQIIRELDCWNANGYVDINADLDKEEEVVLPSCPQCSFAYEESDKFCSNCGLKVAA